MRVIGVHAPGALAESYVAPLECLHRVPEGMGDEVAALAEPVSIGVQANNRGRIREGDSVLVIGAGTIGLCVMLVAKSRGAQVAMSDLSAARRHKALEMGADAAYDPRSDGWREELRGFAQAGGPAVVVEAVGTPQTLAEALDLVVASGRVVQLGLISGEVTIPGNVMVKKELDFVGSRLHCGTVPEALGLLSSGGVTATPLVTHRLDLAEVEKALALMAEAPDEILKGLVELV
jgi:L-gulonate 5-dehydrogenase